MAVVDIVTTLTTLNDFARGRCVVSTDSLTVYFFYVIGGSELCYKKSTDGGATWGTQVEVYNGTVTAFDVYWNGWHGGSGTVIHIAVADATGTDAWYYLNLTIATDALSTPVSVKVTTCHSTLSVSFSICEAASGYLYIAGFTDHATPAAYLMRSVDAGANWTTRTANICEAVALQTDRVELWADTNAADPNDIIAIFSDSSANELSRKLYDDSADSVAETLICATADTSLEHCFSSAYRSSDGAIVICSSTGVSATDDILCYTVTSAAITQKTDVVSNVAILRNPAIYVDPLGTLYCSYARDDNATADTDMEVYYKSSTDGGTTWGSEQTYSAVNDDIDSVFVVPTGSIFIPIYFNDDTATWSCEAANVVRYVSSSGKQSSKTRGRSSSGGKPPWSGGGKGGGFGSTTQNNFAYRRNRR